MKDLKPLSDNYGKIKTVLFALPSSKWGGEVEETYNNIRLAMGENVNYVFFAQIDIPDNLSYPADNEEDPALIPGQGISSPMEYLSYMKGNLQSDILKSFADNTKSTLKAQHDPIVMVHPRIDYKRLSHTVKGQIHSEWVQDLFVVLQGKEFSALVEPMDPMGLMEVGKPFADTYVADQIAAYLKMKRKYILLPSLYNFQGGNMLSGARWHMEGDQREQRPFIIMGSWDHGRNIESELEWSNARRRAYNHPPERNDVMQSVLHYLKNRFNVKDLYISPGDVASAGADQQFGHIDHYITLAGKDPDSDMEIVMVGDLRLGNQTFGNAITAENCQTALATFLSAPPKLIDILDRTAEHLDGLEQDGEKLFKVVRLPLLLVKEMCFSYNNCFVEIYKNAEGQDVKKAYLPDYTGKGHGSLQVAIQSAQYGTGFKAVRKKVEETFMGIGYAKKNIKFIEGYFTKKAARRGSLHCIVKVLERGEY